MRTSIHWFSAGMAAALLIFVATARADEEKISLNKVPKAVLDAVKARFKDAKLTAGTKEEEDGKPVYEVTLKDKGQTIDVILTPEGEILLIEKKIPVKDLPETVVKALEEKYPQATYRIAEEIVKVDKKVEKLAYYEVLLVTAEKKRFEVQVTGEGKIVNVEKK